MSSSSPPEYETVRTELRVKGLPSGWKREVVVRKNGQSAGKTDVYYFSPCGKKFRSKPQIARFLGDSADLTCFDFSRAVSPGDGSQRRRARDRNLCSPGGGGGGGGHHNHSNGGGSTGNIVTRRSDPKPSGTGARPLSTNPLRPSGPVRRTCGVIKLPVIWVAPPNNEQKRDEFVVLDQKREVALHVVVQTHWERRLFGFNPCDHATGSDIATAHKLPNGMVEGGTRKAQAPPAASSSRPPQGSVLSHASAPFLTSTSPISSLTSQSPGSTPPLHGVGPPLHTGLETTLSTNSTSYNQQQTHPSTHSLVSNGNSAQTVELSLPLVTESVVRAQEERVRIIRQQLLAAQNISS